MTMRERLARAMAGNMYDASITAGEFSRQEYQDRVWPDCLSDVDAIIREMMKPTGSMLDAAAAEEPCIHPSHFQAVWQAMLQHILDEGRAAQIPHHGKVNERDTVR